MQFTKMPFERFPLQKPTTTFSMARSICPGWGWLAITASGPRPPHKADGSSHEELSGGFAKQFQVGCHRSVASDIFGDRRRCNNHFLPAIGGSMAKKV